MRTSAIAVYCGSATGTNPMHRDAAQTLGRELAARGITLVFGGGSVGLMGVVADAALAAGGRVVGVITEHLVAQEVAHHGLTELHVVPSMHERKALMVDLSDGIVCLPGGYGTLDEMFEAATWLQLGLSTAPVVLFDVDGYWGPLLVAVDSFAAAGFVRPQHVGLLRRATDAPQAIALALSPSAATADKWGRR